MAARTAKKKTAKRKTARKATAKRTATRTLAQLMSPFTPHLSEEIWALLGGTGLLVHADWPQADPAMLIEDTVTLPIQVNGKRRAEVKVAADADKATVEALAAVKA